MMRCVQSVCRSYFFMLSNVFFLGLFLAVIPSPRRAEAFVSLLDRPLSIQCGLFSSQPGEMQD